jgi:hypothetical protein
VDGRPYYVRVRSFGTWAFALVPVIGLLELGAHVVQTQGSIPDGDWTAARQFVVERARAEDLVAFAPRWADPLGREHFGASVATLAREARADEQRFPRAFEVSIRRAHVPALRSWPVESVAHFGGVTVTTLNNPIPERVLDDLVSDVASGSQRVRVFRNDGSRQIDCTYARGAPQTGGLGFGPAVPGERYVCPGGGFVGVSVMADLDYFPRRCIYAPPLGGGLRVRFADVAFGEVLRGHHGLYVEAERGKTGAPVTLSFRVESVTLGSVVHRDGDGWKPFEFATSGLSGQKGDLVVDISSSGDRRLYCFEAVTEAKATIP